MPWVDCRELRRRLEMEEVLAWMQWHAKERRGQYLRGRCPFCGAIDTPNDRSFAVHGGRRLFNCFRCKQGGDILDLWSQYRKTELNVAANYANYGNYGRELRGTSVFRPLEKPCCMPRAMEKTMKLNLPAEANEFVEGLIAQGKYQNEEEAVVDGIRLLMGRETSLL